MIEDMRNLNLTPEQGNDFIANISVSVCSCEMPAKVKNKCWRCKKPLKEFLQTER